MKEPLWGSNELPEFAVFQYMYDLYTPKNITAVLWNQLVENPGRNQQLLNIPIDITGESMICSDIQQTFNFEISAYNSFELKPVITPFHN